jgi:hypothetical protein
VLLLSAIGVCRSREWGVQDIGSNSRMGCGCKANGYQSQFYHRNTNPMDGIVIQLKTFCNLVH